MSDSSDYWYNRVRAACDKYGIPRATAYGLADYIKQGTPTGSFLEAVLCNDLMGALGRADDQNVQKLREFGMVLYNDTPNGCYGSPRAFTDWIKFGGLEGRERLAGKIDEEEARKEAIDGGQFGAGA